MTIADDIHAIGKHLGSGTGDDLITSLHTCLNSVLGWPYKTKSARCVAVDGAQTDHFAAVIYVTNGADDPDPPTIPADRTAAIIDAYDELDIQTLRAAYARVAAAKELKKARLPISDPPTTTTTLGLIVARRTIVSTEELAAELELLNSRTPCRCWPDMLSIAATSTINYAIQFPGGPLAGDFLPPADGALANYTPAIYVIMVRRLRQLTRSTSCWHFLSPISRFSRPGQPCLTSTRSLTVHRSLL